MQSGLSPVEFVIHLRLKCLMVESDECFELEFVNGIMSMKMAFYVKGARSDVCEQTSFLMHQMKIIGKAWFSDISLMRWNLDESENSRFLECSAYGHSLVVTQLLLECSPIPRLWVIDPSFWFAIPFVVLCDLAEGFTLGSEFYCFLVSFSFLASSR
ncbi:hypothetical protein Tco_0520107 [Tanacetum coccineum]